VRAILQTFLGHLDDIEANVKLVGQLRALGAATAPPSSVRGRLGKAANDVRGTVLSQRTWETIALDGSLLFLAAQYEVTVRDLIQEMMRRKCQTIVVYTDLPEELRTENTRLVGELLRTGSRDPTVDQIQVVEEFLRCNKRGKPVAVYYQGFSHHEHNLAPDELKRLMNRAGVNEFWPRVCRDPTLQTELNCGGVDAAVAAARSVLLQFILDRNAISHRGPSYQTIGASVLIEYIRFFRHFMPALVRALESHLAEMQGRVVQTARGRRRTGQRS